MSLRGWRPALALILVLQGEIGMAAEGDQERMLEIWVNDHSVARLVPVTDRGGVFLLSATDAAAAGIKLKPEEIDANGAVMLTALQGIQTKFLPTEQKLIITAAPDRLLPQRFDLQPGETRVHSAAARGFIGEYDLVGTVDDFGKSGETSSGGAALGGTFFTPEANVTANGFSQIGDGMSQFVRLDTTAEIDEEDTMRRWQLGDIITGSENWSRSVRLGGFQLATDFSLRPDLATLPLPAFFGQTAVPASVDVFVNSARVFETNVESGPFEINNVPVITGGGQATVVVRDVLGQETVVTLPFFASATLLRQGLSSYAFDAGFLRRSYGIDSFDYSDPAATATYSLGYSNALTLEAHGEAAEKVQLAGGGAAFTLGSYGVLHLATAASHSDNLAETIASVTTTNQGQRFGTLHSLSFESQSQPVGFFGQVTATTGDYADIATIGGAAPPKLQIQIGSSLNLKDYGALTESLIEIERKGEQNARLASAAYTAPLGGGWYFGTSGFYDVTHDALVTEAYLSIPLGDRLTGDASLRAAHHDHTAEVGLTRAVNPDGGFGYRLSASAGDNDVKEASATWIGSRGSLDGAFDARNGHQAARLTAAGGIVTMDNTIYATKRPEGAVALVDTGAPNIPIYRENRPVATADSEGKALLTGLVPFAANRISIDPASYDFATVVETTEKTVTPRRQSGVRVDFAPEVKHPALVILHTGDGGFPAAGARVTRRDGAEPLVVGRHGELFVADLNSLLQGEVASEIGACHFAVEPPITTPLHNAIPRIDPVFCIADSAL